MFTRQMRPDERVDSMSGKAGNLCLELFSLVPNFRQSNVLVLIIDLRLPYTFALPNPVNVQFDIQESSASRKPMSSDGPSRDWFHDSGVICTRIISPRLVLKSAPLSCQFWVRSTFIKSSPRVGRIGNGYICQFEHPRQYFTSEGCYGQPRLPLLVPGLLSV